MFGQTIIHQSTFSRILSCARSTVSSALLWVGIVFVFALGHPSAVQAAGVTLSATPTTRTVNAGQSAIYTVNINRDNYTDKVTLSASNLPIGATASFNPNPATGKSSTLTVTSKTTTPIGTFRIRVSGSAAGISIAPITITLTVKAVPSVTLSTLPAVLSIIAGQEATTEVRIARTNYNGPVYLSASNVPEGVTVSFAENPVSGLNTTMRIYSHGLPHLWQEFAMGVNAEASGAAVQRAQLRLLINCGVEWVEQLGSPAEDATHNDRDRGGDVAVDSSGNIYVVGSTYGTVDPQNHNLGSTDVWVAKYNNGGQRLWIRQLGTDKEDRVSEVAVNSDGDVFLGGFTAGEFPGNGHSGNFDFWIAKYDSSGNDGAGNPKPLWVEQDGTTEQDGKFGLVIVPDGAGGGKLATFTTERKYVVHYTFNSNGGLSPNNANGGAQLPSAFRNTPYDLALGPNDTVYVAGSYTNGNNTLSEYVIKYDSQGNVLWEKPGLAAATNKFATRITVDSDGNAYVAGRDNYPGAGMWIAKYDGSNGTVLWTKTESPPDLHYVNALSINSVGDLIVAGETYGVLGERNGGDEPDAWVARRKGSNGDLVWVQQFPVANHDGFGALAFDGSGGIILAGYTRAFKYISADEEALLMRYADSAASPGSVNLPPLPPAITGFSPASSRVGDTIRINGQNFFSFTGVRFNGVPATFTVVSLTAIDAVVPTGATTGLVTISNNCETHSSPAQFTVTP